MKSKSKTKNYRKVTPLNIIIWSSAIVLVVLGIWLTVRLIQVANEPEITPEVLAAKSTEAMAQYSYSMLVLDTQQVVGENTSVAEYVLTTSKEDSYRTYMYRDTMQDMYQCWELNESTGTYDIYIYDSNYEVWVKSEMMYEPLSSDTWLVTASLDGYTILPEKEMWGEDECYVAQITGENSELQVIYEEIYIRCSDYMPLGIISYGVSDTNHNRKENIDPTAFDSFVAEEITVESQTFVEVVSIYSLQFSNESLALFDKPENYFTDAEYMDILSQVESEEVEDGETDD